MGTLDTIIVVVIVIIALVLFYRALKEPLDLVGSLIKRGFLYIKDLFSGLSERGNIYEEIKYG